MRVLVYVEGPSDRDALGALLSTIVASGRQRGVGIRFLALKNKGAILTDSGRNAADHLADNPDDWVFALPDLYPMARYDKTPNEHRSFDDLRQLLQRRFRARAGDVCVPPASRGHFRVHCLKHDLEGLLLAAPDVLKQRLGTSDALNGWWRKPVEDQNDDKPPKRVVEALFTQYRKNRRYQDTIDAPWILERASLESIEHACQQHFSPFVAELRTLAAGQTLT